MKLIAVSLSPDLESACRTKYPVKVVKPLVPPLLSIVSDIFFESSNPASEIKAAADFAPFAFGTYFYLNEFVFVERDFNLS